jgi:hypothetical protein
MGIFRLAQLAIMFIKLYFSFMSSTTCLPLMWSVLFSCFVPSLSCAILSWAGYLEVPAHGLGSYDYSLDQGSVLLNGRSME